MPKRIILTVEDEPLIARLVQVNLERAGYEVDTARDGLEGLERLRSERKRPDLILLDVTMPYMDGFEMLHQIKADPEFRDIPVIIVTARSRNDDILHGQEEGAFRYLTKPISPPDLLAFVREALGETDATAVTPDSDDEAR